jgi:murein DD-endopeptidase MepM/ murein hydrolase activator NlpD
MDPALPLVLVPPIVALGDPVLVRLRAPGAVQATAVLGEQQIALQPTAGDTFVGLLGVPPDFSPGDHAVHVTAIDGGGVPTAQEVILTVHYTPFAEEGIVLDASRQRLLDPALRAADTERLAAEVWSVVTPERLWQGVWTRPVTGTISSFFATERSYNGGPVDTQHVGVDFRAGPGTPVHAPARGRVVLAAPLQVGGNSVWLDHGWGVQSGYLHLREILVEPGGLVEAGQLVGTVGATGRVTGPHLHWEVRVHGVAVQPLEFLRRDVGEIP